MKILIFKKSKFVTALIILSIIIITLYFTNVSPSFAVELSKNSFFNIDVTYTLDEIGKSKEKKAYLTFDDGPTKSATPKILDILKEEKVNATFFVIGKHVKENPEIVKREFEEGHFIANHGYSHNNDILYKNMENFRNEVTMTDNEIAKAIGVDNYCSHIFRFPNRLYVSYLF